MRGLAEQRENWIESARDVEQKAYRVFKKIKEIVDQASDREDTNLQSAGSLIVSEINWLVWNAQAHHLVGEGALSDAALLSSLAGSRSGEDGDPPQAKKRV